MQFFQDNVYLEQDEYCALLAYQHSHFEEILKNHNFLSENQLTGKYAEGR